MVKGIVFWVRKMWFEVPVDDLGIGVCYKQVRNWFPGFGFRIERFWYIIRGCFM